MGRVCGIALARGGGSTEGVCAVRAWVRSVCVVRVRSSLRGVVARRACVL